MSSSSSPRNPYSPSGSGRYSQSPPQAFYPGPSPRNAPMASPMGTSSRANRSSTGGSARSLSSRNPFDSNAPYTPSNTGYRPSDGASTECSQGWGGIEYYGAPPLLANSPRGAINTHESDDTRAPAISIDPVAAGAYRSSVYDQPGNRNSTSSNPWDTAGPLPAEQRAFNAPTEDNIFQWNSSDDENESVHADFEDDNKSDDTIDDFQYAKALQEQLDSEVGPPHPIYGGYRGAVPSTYIIMDQEMFGTIMVRVSSKFISRKWKHMYFRLTVDSLKLYDDNSDCQTGINAKLVYALHPAIFVRKPALKDTYSLVDNGRLIYFTHLRENPPVLGLSKYSFHSKSNRICKFGAYSIDEICSFSYALYGCVLKQQERSAMGGNAHIQGRYA